MNFISINSGQMNYPVGESIQYNKPIIKEMVEAFSKSLGNNTQQVNIICRGSSGAIIASMFSLLLENPTAIFHIKKDGESSHDDDAEYYDLNKGLNIIVDDFMASGRTINSITSKILQYRITEVDYLILSGSVETHRLSGYNFKNIIGSSLN